MSENLTADHQERGNKAENKKSFTFLHRIIFTPYMINHVTQQYWKPYIAESCYAAILEEKTSIGILQKSLLSIKMEFLIVEYSLDKN